MTDLSKFTRIQKYNYDIALSEIKGGKKKSHWMWYIFPQVSGLGKSSNSTYYSIKSVKEAKDYIENGLLYARLIEISNELLKLKETNIVNIFGIPDNLKLQASMTLFLKVSNNDVFLNVLNKYFDGKEHIETINILKNWENT